MAGAVPGPKMTAFHSIMLSGHGLPEIPPGGSVERRLKSRMSLRRQFVDCAGGERRRASKTYAYHGFREETCEVVEIWRMEGGDGREQM